MSQQLAVLSGYLHGMWRYRWSALLITWLLAVAGWFYVFSLPDKFQADAVVSFDNSGAVQPVLKDLASETDTQDELVLLRGILLSGENLLSVIGETDMAVDVTSPAETEQLAESLARSIAITDAGAGERWDNRSNMYEISYESTSAKRAYQVVSTLLNPVTEQTSSSARVEALAAQERLDSQLAESEQRMAIAEQELAEFKKANVGFMPDQKAKYDARLQQALGEVEPKRSALRLAEQRVLEFTERLQDEKPLLEQPSYGPSAAEIEIRLRERRQELNRLLKLYTERHPDVQSVRMIIADLQAQINRENSDPTQQATGDAVEFNPVYQQLKAEQGKAAVEVETLKIQLAEQQAYVKSLRKTIDQFPEVEASLAKLNRDYELARERYSELVASKESTRPAQNAEQVASDVAFRIIEPPELPTQPSGPQRMLLLAGFLTAAIGAGLGWSFVRFQWRPTYISPRQLRKHLGVPVFGSVSLYLSPRHRYRRRFQLVSFFAVAILLASASAGAIWYQDLGTAMVRAFVPGLSS